MDSVSGQCSCGSSLHSLPSKVNSYETAASSDFFVEILFSLVVFTVGCTPCAFLERPQANYPKDHLYRDGKARGRCGRVRAIFFLGCANLLATYAQTS